MTQKIKEIFLLMTLSCCVVQDAVSQKVTDSSSLQQASRLLQHVEAEMKRHPLAFNMSYTYTNEHQPDKILDSLSGSLLLSGNKMKARLGEVEMFCDEMYSVSVMPDDRLIYVSQPTADSVSQQPVQLMMQALSKIGINNCSISQKGNLKVLDFYFPGDMPYRQMSIQLDTVAWRVTEFTAIMKTALLMLGNEDPEGDYEAYACLRIAYSNYNDHPDLSGLRPEFYFINDGGNMMPAPRFSNYKIFVGSPKHQ